MGVVAPGGKKNYLTNIYKMLTRVSVPLFERNLMLYRLKKNFLGKNTQLKWGVLLC